MKNSLLIASISLFLVGCAGASYTVQPLQKSLNTVEKICVVDNPNMANDIQGLINRTINSNGFFSYPISSPALIKEVDFKIYLTYGGSTTTDIVTFIDSFNIAIYDNKHNRIGNANGKVPNNLNLNKWEASEKLVVDMVNDVLIR